MTQQFLESAQYNSVSANVTLDTAPGHPVMNLTISPCNSSQSSIVIICLYQNNKIIFTNSC